MKDVTIPGASPLLVNLTVLESRLKDEKFRPDQPVLVRMQFNDLQQIIAAVTFMEQRSKAAVKAPWWSKYGPFRRRRS